MLDMTSAQLHSLVLGAEESLHSLQLHLETHTQSHIPPLSQELLLETGNSLDPRRPPSNCLPGGLVCNTHTSANQVSDCLFLMIDFQTVIINIRSFFFFKVNVSQHKMLLKYYPHCVCCLLSARQRQLHSFSF